MERQHLSDPKEEQREQVGSCPLYMRKMCDGRGIESYHHEKYQLKVRNKESELGCQETQYEA